MAAPLHFSSCSSSGSAASFQSSAAHLWVKENCIYSNFSLKYIWILNFSCKSFFSSNYEMFVNILSIISIDIYNINCMTGRKNMIFGLAVMHIIVWQLSNKADVRKANCPYGSCPYRSCPVWQLSRVAIVLETSIWFLSSIWLQSSISVNTVVITVEQSFGNYTGDCLYEWNGTSSLLTKDNKVIRWNQMTT